MTIFYHVLQGIVIAAAGVLLWFFTVGLGSGTIDGSNMLIWLVMLAVPIGALFFGMRLWAAANKGAAIALLALPAAPTLLYGLFVLLFIILDPDMR